jgi:hypothetical protein
MSSFENTEQNGQPVSVVHLVMGLIFVGVAGLWALKAAGAIESVELEWLLPLILVAAGAAGLLASLTRGLTRGPTRGRTENDDPDEESFM